MHPILFLSIFRAKKKITDLVRIIERIKLIAKCTIFHRIYTADWEEKNAMMSVHTESIILYNQRAIMTDQL